MKVCSRPSPCTTSASARLSFVTKLGFTGTLWGSWVPSAIVTTDTRSPPICAVMSATSGVDATTRSAADAVSAASEKPNAASQPKKRRLALCEAMAVTPDECGPLEREALVGLLVAPGVVELEAQALELGGLPGDEGGDRLREVRILARRFRVIE